MQLVNVSLIKNPLNWAIIGTMLLILAIGGHLVLTRLGIEPAN